MPRRIRNDRHRLSVSPTNARKSGRRLANLRLTEQLPGRGYCQPKREDVGARLHGFVRSPSST